ncbi:hypothetical protein FZC71_14530 [Bacillus subtilis]|nr:hypothetical protein FZC71_14530 [Bacillus subtilis]
MFIICLECGLGPNLTENQTQYTFHIASNRLQNLLKRRIFFYVSKTMFIFPWFRNLVSKSHSKTP